MTNAPEDEFDYGDLDAPAPAKVSLEDAKRRVSEACDQMEAAERRAAQCQAALEAAEADVKRFKEELIPAMLIEMGFDEVKTNNGTKVSLVKQLRASLSDKDPVRKANAIAWLKNNKCGDIVKFETSVKLPKGAVELVEEFEAMLKRWDRRDEISWKTAEWVEPQTLVANLKDMRANGVDVPMELFAAFEQRYAKIERKK